MPDRLGAGPPPDRDPDARRDGHKPLWLGLGAAALLLAYAAYAVIHPQGAPAPVGDLVETLTGANPRPVKLATPPVQPLSALAQLGKDVFYDPSLSASGTQSCASCHSPQHDYGPPNDQPVQYGGPHMNMAGFRPPPSLTYLYRQAAFSIGPDAGETDNPTPLAQLAAQALGQARAVKTAGAAVAAPAIVPQGGMFWDGRSNTLQMQAAGPMTNPVEMANPDLPTVAAKLAKASYADKFKPLFGALILQRPSLLVAEAMSAVSRYQIEDPSFHRFDSKYDAWLQGKARLSQDELRGMKLFNDPAKANCGGCHLSQVSLDGLPPLFTDTQYEALGAPRNLAIPANRDPRFFDMGVCGPFRTDMAAQTQYCGMFLTPTLRNAARRGVYFHNGVYHSLDEVMRFYDLRSVRPDQIYPHDAAGRTQVYDDLPAQYHANIDVQDAPFDRRPGQPPAMTAADIQDIVAFLRTLDDGYPAR